MKNQTQLLFDATWGIMNLGSKLKLWYNYVFRHRFFSVMKRNVELFKDENAKKTCYICALGPSLKDVDMSRIKGDTFVVNRFYRFGQDWPDFIPTYYGLIDALFAQNGYDHELKAALDMYVPKGTTFFLSNKIEGIPLLDTYAKDHFYYVTWPSGAMNSKKEYRLDKPFPDVQNVSCFAIYYAMLMGYKKIVLLGCDNSSYTTLKKSHCYDDGDQDRVDSQAMNLFSYALVGRTHDELSGFAKRHGVEIVNSTKGSLIDSYRFEIDESLYKTNQ